MSINELSRLCYLNREIETEKRRLMELRAASTSTSAKISGLPHVNMISNKTAIAAEIADVEAIIEEKVKMCILEYNRLNRYIASVNDSLIRQIMVCRFVENMNWCQVAMHIGGGNTPDGVRKALGRFLKNSERLSVLSE